MKIPAEVLFLAWVEGSKVMDRKKRGPDAKFSIDQARIDYKAHGHYGTAMRATAEYLFAWAASQKRVTKRK